MRRDSEVRAHKLRAVAEELHCGGAHDAFGCLRLLRVGKRKRRHLDHVLAGDAQGFAAAGQYPHVLTTAQDQVDESGTGIQQVLAVVQHQ